MQKMNQPYMMLIAHAPISTAREVQSVIGGFHAMSYQANFASHYTRDRHVDFLFIFEGKGKSNKM